MKTILWRRIEEYDESMRENLLIWSKIEAYSFGFFRKKEGWVFEEDGILYKINPTHFLLPVPPGKGE